MEETARGQSVCTKITCGVFMTVSQLYLDLVVQDVVRRYCEAQPTRLEPVAVGTRLSSCRLLSNEQLDLGLMTAFEGRKRGLLACSVLEQAEASLVEPTSWMASAIAFPVEFHVYLGKGLRGLDCGPYRSSV